MFWTPENPRARRAADPHRRFPRSRQPRRGGAPSGALKARAEQRTTSFFWRESCLEIARPARGRPPSGAFDCRCRKGRGPPPAVGSFAFPGRRRRLGRPPHAPAVAPRPSPRALATGFGRFAPAPPPRRPPAAASPPDSWLSPAAASPPPRASAVAVGELVLARCRIATSSPRASAAACDRGPRAVTDSLDLGAPYRSCELRQEPRLRFSARPSPAFGDGLAMECFT